MPKPATPQQGAAAIRPRPSRNGSAPALPVDLSRAFRQLPARLPMAITRLRGLMMRRIARRP